MLRGGASRRAACRLVALRALSVRLSLCTTFGYDKAATTATDPQMTQINADAFHPQSALICVICG
jgi:hypothetical protein